MRLIDYQTVPRDEQFEQHGILPVKRLRLIKSFHAHVLANRAN